MRLSKKHQTTADELGILTGAKYSKNLILPQAVAKLDYEQFAFISILQQQSDEQEIFNFATDCCKIRSRPVADVPTRHCK